MPNPPGRPLLGSAPATNVPARLPPELLARLAEIRARLGPRANDADAIRYAVARVRLPKP